MSETKPMSETPERIADAIEIISMCFPIRDIQGGMWFGHNHNFADATFVDYGVCRAFAVAARALAIQTTRIQELESELASCRECRANLDCLSRGAVPVRDDGAERIRELETALRMFNDRVKAHGDWDDGCFYYNGTSASELQEPMRLADATLQPKDTAK